MNTLIIGSGFGSYGYLPAVYRLSNKIYLNFKYKKKIEYRSELKKYLNKIIWYGQIREIFEKIDYLIIAQNPNKQDSNLRKFVKILKPKHVFLEKPLSNNPSKSINLIKFLEKNRIKFSIGFLFKYLKWYRYIKKKISTNQEFKIIWNIKFNNKNKSWKYNHSEGGGLIRFYSIHFFRIFYELKFFDINKVKKMDNYFQIILSDRMKNNIELEVKYSKLNKFKFIHNKKNCFISSNPFLKTIIKKKDPRVGFLFSYIKDTLNSYKLNYNYEKNFIYFWNKIEKKNEPQNL